MTLLFFGNWWGDLSQTHQIFWAIATIFSLLFLIQTVLSFAGLEFDDVDVGASADTGVSTDSDFNLISVRSMIAFFMLFGWTGVLMLNANKEIWTTVIFASIAGMVGMVMVAYLLSVMTKFNESGNVDLHDAIFQTGEVYIPIPPAKSGEGKIHLKLQGAMKELRAITEGGGVPTGANVRILEVLDNNIMLVESIEEYKF